MWPTQRGEDGSKVVGGHGEFKGSVGHLSGGRSPALERNLDRNGFGISLAWVVIEAMGMDEGRVLAVSLKIQK